MTSSSSSIHPLHFHPPGPSRFGLREIQGPHNRARWWIVGLTQGLFYGLCWLSWDGRPVLSFDFSRQLIHLFGLLLGPQDLLPLALLLMAGAMALFAASVVAGRVFCGFACPQTVYTALFLWLEQRLQGSPGQRARRQRDGRWLQTGVRRLATGLAWGCVALVSGWTLSAYFSNGPALWARTWQGEMSAAEWSWMLGYAGFTMAQAGWLREKVCQHMCPYARFQGVMGGPATQIVHYASARGEPRRGQSQTGGDCVDCGLCVQVCPAGIDIRQGSQYACIACGLCVDACNRVMTAAQRPPNLIGWASVTGQGWAGAWRQPRVIVYTSLALLALGAALSLLAWRTPLQVNVVRDRGTLARLAPGGRVENSYRVQVLNHDTRSHSFELLLPASPAGQRLEHSTHLHLAPGESGSLGVTVSRPLVPDSPRVTPLDWRVVAKDAPGLQREVRSSFVQP